MPLAPFEHCPEVYRGMVDAAPDALVVVDTAGFIRLVNARAEALFGGPRDELIGAAAEGVLPGVFRRSDLPPGDDEVVRLTAGAVRRDGRSVPVEVAVSRMPTPEGVLSCASLRDVSHRVAAEEASERMRDELIATVSHELRTPLTSILGYTEILVDMGEPAISEQAARLLAVVRRNAERELTLVEDMLTLAVLGGAGLSLEPVPTDVGPVVRAVMASLGGVAASAGVSLVRGGQRSLWVIGDGPRLADVIGNLVSNAVNYSEDGGRVEVRLIADGSYGVIEVHDHGMGPDGQRLRQVFDPNFRTPGAIAARVPGAGLGRPIVQGIVEAHAGQVQVESEPGQGTTVALRLPLATSPPGA
ncbi:MAG: PAS domain-containing sensor histidine kinase [Nocardioides sp.]